MTAGIVGTARAMFLSDHDFRVTLLVAAVAGAVALLVATLVGGRPGALVAAAAPRRPAGSGPAGSSCAGGRAVRPSSGTSPPSWQRTSDRLAESRERERRLEEARRELVSWVSHDLRTPLAGLRAMTEALEDGIAADPARYHRQIRAEVDRMTRMVDDLFELSRIHAGTLAARARSRAAGRPGERGHRRRRTRWPGSATSASAGAWRTASRCSPTPRGSPGCCPT